MENNNEKPITVNLHEGQNQVQVLYGPAPKQLDAKAPIKVSIDGTIEAPARWLEKRVGDIDQHRAHVIVDRDSMSICLFINEDDPYKDGSVRGKISVCDIVTKFGINTGKKWNPEQLGQFLKMNRSLFVSKEENMAAVGSLKSFNARVAQDVIRENQENGNRNYAFRQAVESNIPQKFSLRIPVFNGCQPVEVEVETYASIDGTDVTIVLQSAGVNDIMNEARNSVIDKVIEEIKCYGPEIAIIEQ